jgi:hypothetical protein
MRFSEDINNDLKRWDKTGYIVISASISTYDSETLDDEYPLLSDQYIKSQDMLRGDKKGLDNGSRTNRLKAELKKSGFSFKPVWGYFEGEAESSFMIFPYKKGEGEVPFDELYKFGQSLVKEYTQWSVHVHRPGAGSDLSTNDNGFGEVDEYYHNINTNITDKGYSTRTRHPKKPSSITHGFTSDWDDELNDGTKHILPESRLRLFKKVFQESQK